MRPRSLPIRYSGAPRTPSLVRFVSAATAVPSVGTPTKFSCYWYSKTNGQKPTSVTLDSLSTSQRIRQEIYTLIYQDKDYRAVCKLLLENHTNLHSLLGNDGIAVVMRVLVDKSLQLLNQYTSESVKTERSRDDRHRFNVDSSRSAVFQEARHFLESVRLIYSRLLFADNNTHIYANKSTGLVGEYTMTAADYENLVRLEKGWNKRDLCDFLFTQFDVHVGSNNMTFPLWMAKLQLYCGGDPRMWGVKASQLYPARGDVPYLSHFKAQHKNFRGILGAFVNQYQTVSLPEPVASTVMLSMGYYGQLANLRQFIENTWGINENFELTGKQVATGSLQYPQVATLEAIVQSFAYNNEFFEAMKYINAFQQHYSVDISSRYSRKLWEHIFRWVHLSTRFKPEMVLQRFIEEQPPMKTTPLTLAEAKQDSQFNYAKYLQFVDRLHSTRRDTFDQMWHMYTANQKPGESMWSSSIARTYYYHLASYLRVDGDPEPMYELMGRLRQRYQESQLGHNSYNRRESTKGKLRSPAHHIVDIYSMALMQVVEHKVRALQPNQCSAVIEKWSLHATMKKNMNKWLSTRKSSHRASVEKARMTKIAELRREKEEDDEGFLDIM